MTKRTSRSQTVLIGLALLLTPFSDFPIQNTPLGFLGASPSFIPLALLICIFAVGFLFNKNFLPISVLLAILWTGVVGAYGLLVYGTNFLDENLLDKGIRLTVLLLLFLLPFVLTYERKVLRYAGLGAMSILLGGVIWIDMLGDTMFLHGSPNSNMRPRSFTLESSHLSMVVIALTTLTISTLARPIFQIVVGLAGFAVLVYSGSKGGLAVLIAGCALLVIFYFFYALFSGRLSRWIRYTVPLFLLGGFALGYLSHRVVDSLANDLEQYTSSATRVTLGLSSLWVLSQHPLGVGTTGYLPALVENIPIAIRTLEVYSPIKLNFDEIQGYITAQSDKEISTKSFFFDGIIYFGLPFALTFVVATFWLLKSLFSRREWVLFVGSASLILGLMVFSGGLGLYAISFALAWAKARAIVADGVPKASFASPRSNSIQ